MQHKKVRLVSLVAGLLCLSLVAAPFLPGIAVPRAANAAASRTLSRAEMVHRIEGGWMGALWANFTGLPTEFHYVEEPNPAESVPWMTSDVYVTDDDTSLEYMFLHMMEVYGADDITYADMPAEWIYHLQDYIWEGNYNARELMLQGVLPPETGKFGVNPTPEAIDAQIECEIFGMVTPGMLQNALGRTKWWLAAAGDGDVLDHAAFYAMLCSNAFFSDDIRASVREVRSYFGDNTITAKICDEVFAQYEQYPNDWRKARAQLYRKFYRNNYTLDCRINFAMTLMALVYGNGDYKETVQIAVLAGFDNDCNAATAGTIVGLMLGRDGLPADLLAQSGDFYRNTNRPGLASGTVGEIAERIAQQAEEVILGAGGVKNGGEYVIYDGAFTPAEDASGYRKQVSSTESGWTYSGMEKFYNAKYLGGNGYGATAKGAYAEFTFTGDEIAIVSATSVNGGSFALTVDGKACGTISLKAEETFTVGSFVPVAYGQVLRKLRNLGAGTHTVRLTALEDGKWHSVDYAEVPCSEEEYYGKAGLNFARTPAATPVCSVESPLGTGAGGGKIGVIADGAYFRDGDHSSKQYDSFLGRDGGVAIPKDFEDYVGFTFSRELEVAKVKFTEGGHWGADGGWFANGEVRIEVKVNGVWTAVQATCAPAYPVGNTVGAFGPGGETYIFTFPEVRCTGVRVIGTAGGTCKIISCSELEVYGPEVRR